MFLLTALVGIPSRYRTDRCWQTDRTREHTRLLLCAGPPSLTRPDISWFLVVFREFQRISVYGETRKWLEQRVISLYTI